MSNGKKGSGPTMEYDEVKVDEMVLTLPYLSSCGDQPGVRAWKSFDGEGRY